MNIERIIEEEHISTQFQPIVSLKTGSVIGYEALTRGPENTPFYSPIALIQAAQDEDLLMELEFLMRKNAIIHANGKINELFLFINVDPNVIDTKGYKEGMTKEMLRKKDYNVNNIVFEITERSAIRNVDSFIGTLKHFRNQGYLVAIDDVGAGYSGLNRIKEIEPNYIKIDMELIRDIHHHEFKQALINSLVMLTNSTDMKLIAEGIENKDELQTLIRLGVEYGQGYYIGRPKPKLLEIEDKIKRKIKRYYENSINTIAYSSEYHYVGTIASKGIMLKQSVTCDEVREQLNERVKEGAVVLEDNAPVGLVMKNHLEGRLSQRFGQALYGKKPIQILTDTNPLMTDYFTPVNKVMKLAMAREPDHVYDSIIVTKGSEYYGMVTIKKLLEFSMAIEKKYAKELNPLSSLPGNAIIERVIRDLIEVQDFEKTLLYFDLDHFKILNDIFGFKLGDEVILKTANLINEISKKYFSHLSFVGHIGGDDFVTVIQGPFEKILPYTEEIMIRFELMINEYYTDMPIVKKDRYHNDIVFKGVFISIAGLFGDFSSFESSRSLSKIMAKEKENAKRIEGNSLLIKHINGELIVSKSY